MALADLAPHVGVLLAFGTSCALLDLVYFGSNAEVAMIVLWE